MLSCQRLSISSTGSFTNKPSLPRTNNNNRTSKGTCLSPADLVLGPSNLTGFHRMKKTPISSYRRFLKYILSTAPAPGDSTRKKKSRIADLRVCNGPDPRTESTALYPFPPLPRIRAWKDIGISDLYGCASVSSAQCVGASISAYGI